MNYNLLIPMAGEGRRFQEAGYTVPKPFIDVNGQTMLERVLANLTEGKHQAANIILVMLNQHLPYLPPLHFIYKVHGIPGVTQGAACSALWAALSINNDAPLVIANSDQLVDGGIEKFLSAAEGFDGAIMTFPATHPKWSYTRRELGLVVEVAEKNPISNEATVGIYYFARGRDFVRSAKQMIASNNRQGAADKREFYIAPTYNEMIVRGQRIITYQIDPTTMHGLGTPEDLKAYLCRTP